MTNNKTASINTDAYFTKSRKVIENKGDCSVTYAVFMRRPVIVAVKLALDWLEEQCRLINSKVTIKRHFQDGDWAGGGEVLFTYTGKLTKLIELETGILQKVGPTCVVAYNSYIMSAELPNVSLIAMDARHCCGWDMVDCTAYATKVGSDKAKKRHNAIGFIGTSNDLTAHYYSLEKGMGTMPHAFIGYCNSTLTAAKYMDEHFQDQPLTVLVDYFGKEITDSIIVSKAFPNRVKDKSLSVRIDTIKGRYIEGLDPETSYAIIEKYAPDSIRGYRTNSELQHILGPGVSAAAVWHLREKLDEKGFENVSIVASSGFTPEKCRSFALTKSPVDMVGTGSFLPRDWLETYATADIIAYNGIKRVKQGREFLFSGIKQLE